MDILILGLSLLILLWLYRRSMAHAYAAGRAAERAEQDQRKRHGLAVLPEDKPTI